MTEPMERTLADEDIRTTGAGAIRDLEIDPDADDTDDTDTDDTDDADADDDATDDAGGDTDAVDPQA
jgi:hypothetical protein